MGRPATGTSAAPRSASGASAAPHAAAQPLTDSTPTRSAEGGGSSDLSTQPAAEDFGAAGSEAASRCRGEHRRWVRRRRQGTAEWAAGWAEDRGAERGGEGSGGAARGGPGAGRLRHRGLAGLHRLRLDHGPQRLLLQVHQLRRDQRLQLAGREPAQGLPKVLRARTSTDSIRRWRMRAGNENGGSNEKGRRGCFGAARQNPMAGRARDLALRPRDGC